MSQWIPLCKVNDCPPGEGCEYTVAGRVVALFHVDDKFFALEGVCPHQGGPLGKGSLSGCIVTCPWHQWRFDVTNGENQITPHIVQPCLPLRIEEETVLVDLEM